MRRRHHQNIVVAIAEAGRDGEVRDYGMIANTLHSVEKLLRKLGQAGKELQQKKVGEQIMTKAGCFKSRVEAERRA